MLRRQGRGTFVVEHTPAHVLFRFFNIVDEAGIAGHARQHARSRPSVAQADREERTRLGARTARDEVIRITRVRTRDGKPFIAETDRAARPSCFPGSLDLPVIPNTLYDLFQKSTAS